MIDSPRVSQVTLGNVISWGVVLASAAFVYGSLSNTVERNVVVNEHQEVVIDNLKDILNDVKINLAVNNNELRQIRQSLERIEDSNPETPIKHIPPLNKPLLFLPDGR